MKMFNVISLVLLGMTIGLLLHENWVASWQDVKQETENVAISDLPGNSVPELPLATSVSHSPSPVQTGFTHVISASPSASTSPVPQEQKTADNSAPDQGSFGQILNQQVTKLLDPETKEEEIPNDMAVTR